MWVSICVWVLNFLCVMRLSFEKFCDSMVFMLCLMFLVGEFFSKLLMCDCRLLKMLLGCFM